MYFLSLYEGDARLPESSGQATMAMDTWLHYFHLNNLDYNETDELITMEILSIKYE